MRVSALASVAIVLESVLAVKSMKGVLQLPMSHGPEGAERIRNGLERRDSGVDSRLGEGTNYMIELELGTPPQSVKLELDLGSSDLWVPIDTACMFQHGCMDGGTFDKFASTTYKTDGTAFRQHIWDGYSLTDQISSGEISQDVVRYDGHNLSTINFGLVNDSGYMDRGLVGLGPVGGEQYFLSGLTSAPVPNLPQQLQQQGVIQRTAYSLWFNKGVADAGSVIFGGIDHARYTGDIYKMPLIKTVQRLESRRYYALQMTGLSIYDKHGDEHQVLSCNAPVLLEPRSPVSSLPRSLATKLFKLLGAEEPDYARETLVKCKALRSKDGGIGIHLGGVDVTVGFSDLLVEYGRLKGSHDTYCFPGFVTSETFPVIGENILKTLYLVYDLDNMEVGIAAAQRDNVTSSSVEALSTGIPGIRAPANASIPLNLQYNQYEVTLDQFKKVQKLITPTSRAQQTQSGASFIEHLTWELQSGTMRSSLNQSVVIGAKLQLSGAQQLAPMSTLCAAALTLLTSII